MATTPKNDYQSPASRDFTFYSRLEYFNELISRVAKTKKGDRVVLATMSFKPKTPHIGLILDELGSAAQRGVDVDFMVDAFPFLLADGDGRVPGPLLFTRKLSGRLSKTYRARLDALEKLRAKGGRYTIVNKPSRPLKNPFSGRSHIKFAVINDYVFVGACNFEDIGFLDFMAGWEDKTIADWLSQFRHDVEASGSVLKSMNAKDITVAVDGTTRLLLDAGKPNQSLIFDKAIALIDAAEEHILITCQFFPNSVTARHLALAEARGVKVQILYNHPDKHTKPFNLLHRGVIWVEKRNKPRDFFSQQLPKGHDFLHAKLLTTDKGTIVGSHNYVHVGVKFGTAEIALMSSEPKFGEQATLAIKSQLDA